MSGGPTASTRPALSHVSLCARQAAPAGAQWSQPWLSRTSAAGHAFLSSERGHATVGLWDCCATYAGLLQECGTAGLLLDCCRDCGTAGLLWYIQRVDDPLFLSSCSIHLVTDGNLYVATCRYKYVGTVINARNQGWPKAPRSRKRSSSNGV